MHRQLSTQHPSRLPTTGTRTQQTAAPSTSLADSVRISALPPLQPAVALLVVARRGVDANQLLNHLANLGASLGGGTIGVSEFHPFVACRQPQPGCAEFSATITNSADASAALVALRDALSSSPPKSLEPIVSFRLAYSLPPSLSPSSTPQLKGSAALQRRHILAFVVAVVTLVLFVVTIFVVRAMRKSKSRRANGFESVDGRDYDDSGPTRGGLTADDEEELEIRVPSSQMRYDFKSARPGSRKKKVRL